MPPNATNRQESATRNVQVSHCENVPKSGRPSEVMQADEVCISEMVTALTDMSLTRKIKRVRSSPDSEPKIMLIATGEKTKSANAHNRDIAAVRNMARHIRDFAAGISPRWASGDICGTPAAARP